MTKRVVLTSIGICLLAACEMPRPGNDVQQQDATQDIVLSDIVPMPDVAADSAPDASEAEAGATDASDAAANADSADVMPPPACPTAASDFQPRTAMGTWAAPWSMCQAVSMANAYPYFSMSASAPGRVRTLGALEGAGRFFDPTRDPTPSEFAGTGADAGAAAAADLFTNSGVATRYQRRADEHYAAPMGLALNSTYQDFCGGMSDGGMYSDYCTGPMSLNSVHTRALENGFMGVAPTRVHAAKIQAAYQWWLYISAYKESLTCAPVSADCDSAAGYYTGGANRDSATQYGLARELLTLGDTGREAHDRIWDALLAVRCWRDMDGGRPSDGGATSPASNEALREQARTQLDRALTRGVVMILQSRLRAFASTDANPARALERQAHAAWLGVVGPLFANGLERWSRGWWASQRASANAAVVARVVTELRAGEMMTTTQAGRASADLEALFPCP
jgi:hypothetical protein